MSEVTLQDARAHLGHLLNRAAHGQESITITRYGYPEGVLISAESYRELEQLRRERDRRDLSAAMEAERHGEVGWVRYDPTSHEELLTGLDDALDLSR